MENARSSDGVDSFRSTFKFFESKAHIRAPKIFQSFTCASMPQRARIGIKGMEEGRVTDADALMVGARPCCA
jgi:hypothetical protein